MFGKKKTEGQKELHVIHDKYLPTIVYNKSTTDTMTKGNEVLIHISDHSSEKALETFKELKKEVKL